MGGCVSVRGHVIADDVGMGSGVGSVVSPDQIREARTELTPLKRIPDRIVVAPGGVPVVGSGGGFGIWERGTR